MRPRGFKHTNTTKEKIRLKLIGNQNTKGLKMSLESRRKMATAKFGNTWNIGKSGGFKGRHHTNKTKSILSEMFKGRYFSIEWKNKLKQSRLHQVFPIKDTKPERLLQNSLNSEQIKFIKHKEICGQPDIFIEPNLCIFVDGDYWHNLPKSIKRDIFVTEELERAGYIVIRIWEHEIYNNMKNVILRVLTEIEKPLMENKN